MTQEQYDALARCLAPGWAKWREWRKIHPRMRCPDGVDPSLLLELHDVLWDADNTFDIQRFHDIVMDRKPRKKLEAILDKLEN